MVTISLNTDDTFSVVRSIAAEVWPIAYGSILSSEQLDYMMQMMYSVESLQKQTAESGHQLLLAADESEYVGFASFERNYNGEPKTKIHKLYVLFSCQKKGAGRKMVDYIADVARKHNQKALILNVNRFNEARYFYEKLGFEVLFEEDIAIGNGYLMEDFVMGKKIVRGE
ncbi:MAG: GNAT family N-acetyltransferase [Flavobacterium sp.]